MTHATKRIVATLLVALAGPALAQVAIERKATAKPGQETRIGVFANVKADCTPGPLPTITLAQRPQNGTVLVRPGKVRLTNHRNCLAIEVPGYVATYKSKPGFNGLDIVALELKGPTGSILQKQTIKVTVGDGSGVSL